MQMQKKLSSSLKHGAVEQEHPACVRRPYSVVQREASEAGRGSRCSAITIKLPESVSVLSVEWQWQAAATNLISSRCVARTRFIPSSTWTIYHVHSTITPTRHRLQGQATMSHKAIRRAVRALSVQEKLQAIDRVQDGESKAAVARDIGVPESTLRGWCKGEEKLRSAAARQMSISPSSDRELSTSSDVPLDFSRDRTTPSPIAPPEQPRMQYKTPAQLKQEAMLYWLQQTSALTVPPLETHTPDSAGWFWKWYKSYGVLPQLPIETPKEDNEQMSEDEDDPPATAAAAVQHGEKFLRWLECCSDPSVTAVQILQFRYLLNNVKDCADRRRQGRVTKIRRRK